MEFHCSARCSRILKVFLVLYMLWFLVFISEGAPKYLHHACIDTTIYNPNSTYQVNLNSLLSSLASNERLNDLFYNATAGDNAPDKVYGLYMCRGDLTNDICHNCVVTAIREIVERCPKEKEAHIWYEECMLRCDDESIFSTMKQWPETSRLNETNVTEPDRLETILGEMNKLAARASNGPSATGERLKGFATGETNLRSFQTLYSLVQCTPDLSGDDCNWCLQWAIGQIPNCCIGTQGGIVLAPSCNLRYEIYRFYRNTLAFPPPPPTSPTSPGGKGYEAKSSVAKNFF